MTEIPESVRLYGRTFKLEPVPEAAKHAWNGLLDHTKGIIYLDTDLDAEHLLRVLLHEATHVYQVETVRPFDEAECQAIAFFIHQLLYDNSWIAEAYCGEEEKEKEVA